MVYTACVELTGTVYDIGAEGKTSVAGPGGVVFTLHQTGFAESSPESGPIAKFLYSPYVQLDYVIEMFVIGGRSNVTSKPCL